MNEIKCNELLPKSLRIYSAENQLYRIGLCLKRPKIATKRHCYSKPIFIAFIIWYYLLTLMITLKNNGKNEFIVLFFGDFSQIIGIGKHYKIATIIWLIFVISNQCIYYYNYWKGIEPTFLSVFEMMSGLVTPNSIGLSDPQSVYRLVKTSKTLFSITTFVTTRTIPLSGFLILYPYLMNTTILETILYGMPNLIAVSLIAYTNYNISVWSLTYFYILCYYIKIKITNIQTNSKNVKTLQLISSLNKLYIEINEYNTTYWSKYLMSVWFLLGLVIVMGIFGIIFLSADIYTKFMIGYIILIMAIMLFFIIIISCSVNFKANQFYKLLNNLMITYVTKREWNRIYNNRVIHNRRHIIKVCINSTL